MHFSGTSTQEESSEENGDPNLGSNTTIFSDCTGTKPKFRFPPAPRLVKSETNSVNSSYSDSSNSSSHRSFKQKRRNRTFTKNLPPMGFFWDIENCQVPKSKSASAVVQKIRETFLCKYRESEFIVVCDVTKESPHVIHDLHDSQVNLIHVSGISKNAADDKLRQSLRRFAELHPAPSGVVLITSDINFAADLSDLRYRKKIRVILVHNANVREALLQCAHEHYNFVALCENLPKSKPKVAQQPAYLTITNLPVHVNTNTIRCRLKMITDNCGGRVTEIFAEEGLAHIRFWNVDFAKRNYDPYACPV